MFRVSLAVSLALALGGSAAATPAMTAAPTKMREAPRSNARVVQSIPANAQIDIAGCGKIWCSASWRDISGFVAARAVSTADSGPPLVAAAPPAGPPVVVGAPVVVAPFGWGYYGYGWHRRYYY